MVSSSSSSSSPSSRRRSMALKSTAVKKATHQNIAKGSPIRQQWLTVPNTPSLSADICSISRQLLVDIVGIGKMPKFVNLTRLELLVIVDWYKVVKFFEVADNLQVLIISLLKVLPYTEPERVPPCMLSRLRTVALHCFGTCEDAFDCFGPACEDAFDLVRYILGNARALEKMEIYPLNPSSYKDNFNALQRISMFERGLTSCRLDFKNTNDNAD